MEVLFPTKQNKAILDWVKTHYKPIYQGLQSITPVKLPSEMQSLVEIINTARNNAFYECQNNEVSNDTTLEKINLISDDKLLLAKPKQTKTSAKNPKKAIMEKATQDTLSLQSSDSIKDLKKTKQEIERKLQLLKEQQNSKTHIAQMQKQSLDKLLDSVPEEYIQQYMDSRIKDK
jgi:hypothetical protein